MQGLLQQYDQSGGLSGPDIGYREAIDEDVHNIVDDDEQPARHPGGCSRIKARFGTVGPRRAVGPGTIFHPDNVSRQMPAINDEVSSEYHGEGVRILGDKEKRQNIKCAMNECRGRALEFFRRHPFALQKVITDGVSDKLISCEHQHPFIESFGCIASFTVSREIAA